jgi:hypothetical protein
MAKERDLKQLFATAAAASRKPVTDAQLGQAARELLKRTQVNRADVDLLSESITRDKETFAAVDIDDINDVLARGDD